MPASKKHNSYLTVVSAPEADTTPGMEPGAQATKPALTEAEKRIFVAVANAHFERIYAKLFTSLQGRLTELDKGAIEEYQQEEALQVLYLQGAADLLEEFDAAELLQEFEQDPARK